MSDAVDRLKAALADRYRIERQLGQGGMATVYLAHDVKHDRKVALKVLKPELAAVLGAERFVVEIKTTASLQHPHILPLFDSGTADGFLYYVMPYIEGETLRGKLNRETQLGIEEAIRITTQVADALDYAHRHGVIHRDIKPENILLHDGRPMVADFGIALAVSAAAGGRMTETGLSLGTPHYMSPEQATADKDITGRSDIYSLGSVLYEMLTGEPPHTGGSAQQIIMKIIAEEAQQVSQLRKSVPSNIAAAVAKALEKLPADRFESAKAFAAALSDERYGPTLTRATGVARRTSNLTGIGRLALVAVLAFGAAWVIKGAEPAPAASGPIFRFDVPLPPGFSSTTGGLQILPDGSGFSFLADGPGGRGVVVQSFAGSPPRFFPAPAASIGSYVLRDGSGALYYALPGGNASQVQMVPFSGAPPRVVTDSLRFGLAVDNAGRLYATHLNIGGLTRVDPSGRVELLTRPDSAAGEMAHWFPTIVSEGRVLAFHIGYRDGRPARLAFLDLRNRNVHRSVEGSNAQALPNGDLVYARDGSLYAGRVDLSRLDFLGTPTPVLRGVTGHTVSETGSLLYRPATDSRWDLRAAGVGASGALMAGDGESVGGMRLGPGGSAVLTVEGQGKLWVRTRDGASRRLIVPDRPHRLAGWSADGSRILYVEYDGDPGYTYSRITGGKLMVLRVDGTGAPEPLGRGTGDRVREAEWGRGGIAYATLDGTIRWLADGRAEPVAVAQSEPGTGRQSWAEPAVSPDARFISFRGRNSSLVVAAIPPATGMWEVGPGLNSRWSRDGRYLYFDQIPSPYQVAALPVMRVQVTPGAAFSFGKPDVAATPPPGATLLWDLGPGNGVYWVTQAQSRQSVLVVNWAREVDSLMRASAGAQP